jgi:transglutaminase-like putative cysteine protease
MKTPPFILFAALIFWGWLSDFLVLGAVLGAVLEISRFIKFRWELDDTDFNRIWSFCVLLNIVLIVYVFTNNEEGGLGGMLHGHSVSVAANSTVLTSIRFLRWLPLTTYAFLLAQVFNARPTVPLTAISLVLRWRRRLGEKTFAGHYYDISYPYFFVCLFSAGVHANSGDRHYLYGLVALIAWALWFRRSRRYGMAAWLGVLATVCVVGLGEMAGFRVGQGALQNLNSQFFSWLANQNTDPLQSRTSMGRIGKMKLSARIVVRVQPRQPGDAPAYLREASYRDYRVGNSEWRSGGAHEFDDLQSESDNTTWNLQPQKKVSSAVGIACYLTRWSPKLQEPEGLLPLPTGCARLENLPPYMILSANKNGAVLAAGRGLVIFDALYGPGATLDAPPDVKFTNSFDLTVPTNEIPALQQVIGELQLPADADDVEKKRRVEKFFTDRFTYSTWQGLDKLADANASPLTKFLLTSRSGHCEYFATATVLLLRQMGIPARYGVGYAVHEASGSGFVVRARDAHAWCLAWNAATKSWDDFDTTPASWVAIETERTSAEEWFANLRSWISFQFAKFRWRQAQWQQYIFWSLIPVMAVLLYYIIFQRRGKLRSLAKNKSAEKIIWPGLDSEFYALEKKLAARGVPRQPGEPLGGWLERALAAPTLANLRPALRELLRLHYAHRFDPAGLSGENRARLQRDAAECLGKISALG